MSTFDAARGPSQSMRRTTATSGARPRIASSRIDEAYLDSVSEVRPHDSASNAPHRRVVSGSQRANGAQRVPHERRVEKSSVTITDKVHIRTRSPAKLSSGDAIPEQPILSGDILKGAYRPPTDAQTSPHREYNRVIC